MSSYPRFFVPPQSIITASTETREVLLPPEASHHAKTVLRLRVGEKLWAHDGQNRAFLCEIVELSSTVRTSILEEVALASEPQTRLTIAQSLPKTGEKIEQVLQHGTEVGAAGFLVFESERSVARLENNKTEKKAEKKIERWRGIVQSAAEQSGRGVLPSVEWVGSNKNLAKRFSEFDAVVIFHEKASGSLAAHLPEGQNILLLIGPEGGFSEREVGVFTEAGAVSLSLGPRVLRTETAALVALAQILVLRA
jgi:16S rRNA (uracil1498-N3)-methyltransferase